MKKIFLYISIGITLLAIPMTVFLVGKNQEIRKRAAPASTLSFTPSSQNVKVGEPFTLDVKIDAATNQVGTVQLRIVFDPAYLTAQDITNGPLAPSIRASKKIDPNGKVSISVGAKDNTHPIIGSGTIATLTMTAIKASATPISIKFTASPDTAANAIEEGENDVIIGRAPASVTITNADGSAEPAVQQASGSALIATPTPTLIPTLAASQEATTGATATTSAVLITSIKEDQVVATESPVIRGKGIPGTTITIVIHSDTEQTAVVTVDANGNWVFTPSTPLEPGPHTITAQVTDTTTGKVQTATTEFSVGSANATTTPATRSVSTATGSAIPATGTSEITVMLVILGVLLFISGAFLPI
jgi:hypothetical protein